MPFAGAKVGCKYDASESCHGAMIRYRRGISQRVEFYGQKCAYCQQNWANSADHFVPFSFNHDNSNMNLVPCCGRCNSIAGNIVFETFAEKQAHILDRRAKKQGLVATYCPNGCGITYARKGQDDRCPDCGVAV